MQQKAQLIIEALGGPQNIKELDGCVTRLRVTVVDRSLVNDAKLRAAGAIGVLKIGTGIQAVVGTHAELIAQEINKILKPPA